MRNNGTCLKWRKWEGITQSLVHIPKYSGSFSFVWTQRHLLAERGCPWGKISLQEHFNYPLIHETSREGTRGNIHCHMRACDCHYSPRRTLKHMLKTCRQTLCRRLIKRRVSDTSYRTLCAVPPRISSRIR